MAENWGNNTLAALARGGTEAISRLLIVGFLFGVAGAIVIWISKTLDVSAVVVVIAIPVIIALIVWVVVAAAPNGNPERRKQGWVDTEAKLGKARDETSIEIQDDIVRLLKLDVHLNVGSRDGFREIRRGLQELQGLPVTWSSKDETIEDIHRDIRLITGIAFAVSLNQKAGFLALRYRIEQIIESQSKPKRYAATRTRKKATVKQ